MNELVGFAAIQQSSDSWKWIQDDSLRMGINVVLETQIYKPLNFLHSESIYHYYKCYFFYIMYVHTDAVLCIMTKQVLYWLQ